MITGMSINISRLVKRKYRHNTENKPNEGYSISRLVIEYQIYG